MGWGGADGVGDGGAHADGDDAKTLLTRGWAYFDGDLGGLAWPGLARPGASAGTTGGRAGGRPVGSWWRSSAAWVAWAKDAGRRFRSLESAFLRRAPPLGSLYCRYARRESVGARGRRADGLGGLDGGSARVLRVRESQDGRLARDQA